MSRPVPRPFCPTCGKRVVKIQRVYCDPACFEARRRTPMILRFWRMVSRPANPTHCWEWTGPRVKGYGVIRDDSQEMRKAHRISWEWSNAVEVPPGMLVCHWCDNPPCVNPAHLFVGTVLDNNRDRDAKGRGRHYFRERKLKQGVV